MTFTYGSDFTVDRDLIRTNVGDTNENAGPRPDKRNFSDEEIAGILTIETYTNAATARLFEILAAEWTPYALRERKDDVEYDAKGLPEQYNELAAKWRAKENGGDDSSVLEAGVIALDFMQKGSVLDE